MKRNLIYYTLYMFIVVIITMMPNLKSEFYDFQTLIITFLKTPSTHIFTVYFIVLLTIISVFINFIKAKKNEK
ncbi:MAG: hypothetical protein ACI81I_000724 [Arcobacteraceae bacterium]|jgi:hypothetical protein